MKIKIPPGVLYFIVMSIYRLMCRTMSFEVKNMDQVTKAWEIGRQVVFACWHNELFLLPWLNSKVPEIKQYARWVAIVSASKDGDMAADILHRQGVATSRGSSSRGGVRALMGAVRIMKKEGRQGAISVDGPRGPRHKVKDGVLLLAQKTNALVVPMRSFSSKQWVFKKSWDQFEVPKPFSRCRVVVGDPYELPSGKITPEMLERERTTLECKLNGLG